MCPFWTSPIDPDGHKGDCDIDNGECRGSEAEYPVWVGCERLRRDPERAEKLIAEYEEGNKIRAVRGLIRQYGRCVPDKFK